LILLAALLILVAALFQCLKLDVVQRRLAAVVSEEIKSVALRPTRRQKKVEVCGNSIKFTLCRADYCCLEVNGDLLRPLLIFCDERIEKQIYDGQNLLYFGKGYTVLGEYVTSSNTVIFIDEGAVV
jgi:hypothetical protein